MRALRRTPQLLATVLVASIAIAAGSAAYAVNAWSRLEGDTVDLRFALRPHHPPSDVAVVAIDAATFSELGRPWPFSRALHAKAIDRLHAAGAKEIVYDIQFTEPTSASADLALYRAIGRARGVVLATTEVDDRGRTNVLGGDANLARVNARAGASNIPSDPGGVVRRFTYAVSGLKTLAVTAAEQAKGTSVPQSLVEADGAWIDYRGPPATIPTVSFSRLIKGRVNPRLLRGKVVVVGASAPTLQDVHPTPTSRRDLMSGPEIQANAIWTVLHGVPLRSAPPWLDLLAIAALGLAVPLAGLRLRGLRSAIASPLVAVAYSLLAQLAFESGTVLALTYPLTALVLGMGGTVTASYLTESRERRRVTRYSARLELEVRARTEELRETQVEIVRRLGQAAESRDEETGHHIERISRMCYRLGRAAGMSINEAELLRDASAMHDLGKIGIPDQILFKLGDFTREEREIMKTHTKIGAAILAGSGSSLVQMAELIALTHHERWDGTGYPAGLTGKEIPLGGRICAICDVFDALMSKRRYKEAWPIDAALAEIKAQAGHALDPDLVDIFLRLAGEMYGDRRTGAELPRDENSLGRKGPTPTQLGAR